MRIGWSTGEREVEGGGTSDGRIQGEVEASCQLRVACRSEPIEMACARIDKKNAAIGRLQQRRHRPLRSA
jgi:hypothetical protein